MTSMFLVAALVFAAPCEAEIPFTDVQVFPLSLGKGVRFVAAPDGLHGIVLGSNQVIVFSRTDLQSEWQHGEPIEFVAISEGAGFAKVKGDWHYLPNSLSKSAIRLSDQKRVTLEEPRHVEHKWIQSLMQSEEAKKWRKRAQEIIDQRIAAGEEDLHNHSLLDASQGLMIYSQGEDWDCAASMLWLEDIETGKRHRIQPYGECIQPDLGIIRVGMRVTPDEKFLVILFYCDIDGQEIWPERVQLFTRQGEYVKELFMPHSSANSTWSRLSWQAGDTLVFETGWIVSIRNYIPAEERAAKTTAADE